MLRRRGYGEAIKVYIATRLAVKGAMHRCSGSEWCSTGRQPVPSPVAKIISQHKRVAKGLKSLRAHALTMHRDETQQGRGSVRRLPLAQVGWAAVAKVSDRPDRYCRLQIAEWLCCCGRNVPLNAYALADDIQRPSAGGFLKRILAVCGRLRTHPWPWPVARLCP